MKITYHANTSTYTHNKHTHIHRRHIHRGELYLVQNGKIKVLPV